MDDHQANALRDYVETLKPSLFGRMAYYLLPYRKRVVESNLTLAFAEILSVNQRRRLAMAFYGHLLRSIKENIRLRFMTLNQIKHQAVVEGIEHLYDVAKQGHGVMVLTGHFGNWELSPVAGILNFQAYRGKFFFIRKTLRYKWLEKLLFNRFYRAGLGVIAKKNALMNVMAALEAEAVVVFVLDQHACVGSKDGIAVPFFGKPAGTYRSLATFARVHQASVVPAHSYRRADGKHVLAFLPPIPWQELDGNRQALMVNTQRYNQALEAMILQHPEQWLWAHRRWKL